MYYSFECFILPGDFKVNINRDQLFPTVQIVSPYSIVQAISSEIQFFNYIEKLGNTYSEIDWYKVAFSFRECICSAGCWDSSEKIKQLLRLRLLSNLELIIYSLYKPKAITRDILIDQFKYSLADSTLAIFDNKLMYKDFDAYDDRYFDALFLKGTVKSGININLLNDTNFAKYLGIKGDSTSDVTIFTDPYFVRDYNNELKKSFRTLENELRSNTGYDPVGAFFKEKLLFETLKIIYPFLNIITQYSPYWLTPQRIDIFIEDLNLAIEYNGSQHYRPIEFFGGEQGFLKIKELDSLKSEKCAANNVILLIIRYDEDWTNAIERVKAKVNELATKNNLSLSSSLSSFDKPRTNDTVHFPSNTNTRLSVAESLFIKAKSVVLQFLDKLSNRKEKA